MRAGLVETLIKPVLQIGEVRGRGSGGAVHPPAAATAAATSSCRRLAMICPDSRASYHPQRLPLKEGIASFYDESSQLWESMWVS